MSWCVINRTKKRRMLMVWGREGKPASLKMWVVLTAKRLWCWGVISVLSSWSNQNRLIDPTRLTAKNFFFFFFINSFSTLSQEEVSRGGRDDRPSVPAILSERKMDSSAVGNHNKVKVMATQLLAKFEENAPAQQTGLKRQVGGSHAVHFEVLSKED